MFSAEEWEAKIAMGKFGSRRQFVRNLALEAPGFEMQFELTGEPAVHPGEREKWFPSSRPLAREFIFCEKG